MTQWPYANGSARPSPPGAVILWPTIYLVTVACLGTGLYATSLPGWDFGLAGVAFLASITIAGFWAVSFVTVAGRGRIPNRALARWVGIPVLGYLSLALALVNVPGTVRFDLSRPALEEAARADNAPAQPGWIGLMPIGSVRRDTDGTTIFIVDNSSGWGYCGFAYNPERTPVDEADGLGGQVADGWWSWCEPWMD